MANSAEIAALFAQGRAAHQRGDFAQAQKDYDAILQRDPKHFDALHLLGLIAAQGGQLEKAKGLFERAIAANPNSASAHSNLGNVLRSARRYADAIASFDRAMALDPRALNALTNRGIAYLEMGRTADALKDFDSALAADPKFILAVYGRGNALRQTGQAAEALAAYDRCLAIEPRFAPAQVDRANLLAQMGRFEDAVAAYDAIIKLAPNYIDGIYNQGVALLRLGRAEEALARFDKVLEGSPDAAGPLVNRAVALVQLYRAGEALRPADHALRLDDKTPLAWAIKGRALLDLGRPDEALVCFDRVLALSPPDAGALTNRAIALGRLHRNAEAFETAEQAAQLDPRFAGAWNSRGHALAAMNRYAEAVESFEKAIEIEPNFDEALANAGAAAFASDQSRKAIGFFGKLVAHNPDFPYALGNALHVAMHCCEWYAFDDLKARAESALQAGRRAIQPHHALVLLGSAAGQRKAAEIWVKDRYARLKPLTAPAVHAHDKIRLAYLSADFRDHPMPYLMLELFETHDRARFETIALSFGRNDGSPMRASLEKAFDRFIDVSDKSDRECVDLLREMEIDIAVDLKGHTDHARPGIFAMRGCGIQVSYMGHAGTTGADFIDYLIADDTVVPEELAQHYSEKIIRLPDTYWVNDPRHTPSAIAPTRSEVGLPEQGFVLCCFNQNVKFTPDVFAVWMRLLQKIDGSVLWLLRTNDLASENLKKAAVSHGVAPERIVFAQRAKVADHLARHRLADLFLDTLPYNAHTTAADALRMGLPVVTCMGESFASRVCASLLQAADVPDTITTSLADYEALALKLARDPAALASVKAKLGGVMNSRLFDTGRFRSHMEAAYIEILARHRRGERPADTRIAPIS
jgi:predicted O-linked N-acetylglucosamine transferase (SPINDLY family)